MTYSIIQYFIIISVSIGVILSLISIVAINARKLINIYGTLEDIINFKNSAWSLSDLCTEDIIASICTVIIIIFLLEIFVYWIYRIINVKILLLGIYIFGGSIIVYFLLSVFGLIIANKFISKKEI